MEAHFLGELTEFWQEALQHGMVTSHNQSVLGIVANPGLGMDAFGRFTGIASIKTLWVNLPACSAMELLKALPPHIEEVVVFAGWPTLAQRPKWELAFAHRNGANNLGFESRGLLKQLDKEPIFLADRVGLYTPRLLGMIINEAWFMLAEGSGTEADIDTAMLLGVNYPKGPFQWGKEIGLQAVVVLLKQVQEATGDPRYKVCPLLQEKAEALAI